MDILLPQATVKSSTPNACVHVMKLGHQNGPNYSAPNDQNRTLFDQLKPIQIYDSLAKRIKEAHKNDSNALQEYYPKGKFMSLPKRVQNSSQNSQNDDNSAHPLVFNTTLVREHEFRHLSAFTLYSADLRAIPRAVDQNRFNVRLGESLSQIRGFNTDLSTLATQFESIHRSSQPQISLRDGSTSSLAQSNSPLSLRQSKTHRPTFSLHHFRSNKCIVHSVGFALDSLAMRYPEGEMPGTLPLLHQLNSLPTFITLPTQTEPVPQNMFTLELSHFYHQEAETSEKRGLLYKKDRGSQNGQNGQKTQQNDDNLNDVFIQNVSTPQSATLLGCSAPILFPLSGCGHPNCQNPDCERIRLASVSVFNQLQTIFFSISTLQNYKQINSTWNDFRERAFIASSRHKEHEEFVKQASLNTIKHNIMTNVVLASSLQQSPLLNQDYLVPNPVSSRGLFDYIPQFKMASGNAVMRAELKAILRKTKLQLALNDPSNPNFPLVMMYQHLPSLIPRPIQIHSLSLHTYSWMNMGLVPHLVPLATPPGWDRTAWAKISANRISLQSTSVSSQQYGLAGLGRDDIQFQTQRWEKSVFTDIPFVNPFHHLIQTPFSFDPLKTNLLQSGCDVKMYSPVHETVVALGDVVSEPISEPKQKREDSRKNNHDNQSNNPLPISTHVLSLLDETPKLNQNMASWVLLNVWFKITTKQQLAQAAIDQILLTAKQQHLLDIKLAPEKAPAKIVAAQVQSLASMANRNQEKGQNAGSNGATNGRKGSNGTKSTMNDSDDDDDFVIVKSTKPHTDKNSNSSSNSSGKGNVSGVSKWERFKNMADESDSDGITISAHNSAPTALQNGQNSSTPSSIEIMASKAKDIIKSMGANNGTTKKEFDASGKKEQESKMTRFKSLMDEMGNGPNDPQNDHKDSNGDQTNAFNRTKSIDSSNPNAINQDNTSTSDKRTSTGLAMFDSLFDFDHESDADGEINQQNPNDKSDKKGNKVKKSKKSMNDLDDDLFDTDLSSDSDEFLADILPKSTLKSTISDKSASGDTNDKNGKKSQNGLEVGDSASVPSTATAAPKPPPPRRNVTEKAVASSSSNTPGYSYRDYSQNGINQSNLNSKTHQNNFQGMKPNYSTNFTSSRRTAFTSTESNQEGGGYVQGYAPPPPPPSAQSSGQGQSGGYPGYQFGGYQPPPGYQPSSAAYSSGGGSFYPYAHTTQQPHNQHHQNQQPPQPNLHGNYGDTDALGRPRAQHHNNQNNGNGYKSGQYGYQSPHHGNSNNYGNPGRR